MIEVPAFTSEEHCVALRDRLRRFRPGHAAPDDADAPHAVLAPVPAHLMPEVNQRVTVTMGEHVPVPSRVEDVASGAIMLARPALPLEFGDPVVMTWERDGAWFSLDTRVLGVDEYGTVPTVHVAAGGRLSRYDERRNDVRRAIDLALDLRVVRARAVRAGHELQTRTTELSANAVRFVTSAPFAPGDLMEMRLNVGGEDTVSARLRVIRLDAVTGSWRSTCTAAFDDILRSDRSRLLALADAAGRDVLPPAGRETMPTATPPTLDGVGGRDQPEDFNTLDSVVDWIKRRGESGSN
ncbi:MAG: hypothetical protein JWO69_1637 [Thermoleophilia bacterium]|nr:hypothetical protein [Thermoleophilia bacterium]